MSGGLLKPVAAGWRPRLGAALVDTVFLAAASLLVVLVLLQAGAGTEAPPADSRALAEAVSASALLQAAPLIALVFLFALRQLLGATPGHLVLGVRVVRETDARAARWGTVIARGLALALALLPLGLGVASMLWSRDRRALHDRLTGTRVVEEDESRLGANELEALL